MGIQHHEDFNEPAPRLNRRQQAKNRTYKKVLDTARDLFMEKGYEKATIRDIATGANMSTGAVFANFKNKADLFMAVAQAEFSERNQRMEAEAQKNATLIERILGISAVDYELYLDRLPLSGMLSSLSWPNDPQIGRYLMEAELEPVSLITKILEEGKRLGQFAPWVDPPTAASIVWAVHTDNYRTAVFDDEPGAILDGMFTVQLSHVILAFKN